MTPTELRSRALQELGVLATGEDANAADGAIVDQKYAALYEMLVTEGLVTWSVDDEIPEFAEQPMIWMTAHLCAGSFGVSPQKKSELEQLGALNLLPAKGGPSLAERQLRRQLAKGFVYQPVQTEYF